MGQGSGSRSMEERCFEYTFDEHLQAAFCVNGNCCPDSQRFDLSYTVFEDSIVVTVVDTAQNLCRCLCDYLIQTDLTVPPQDYQFIVYVNGKEQYREKVSAP